LAEGRLVQLGTPREVYERPRNIYVARRLGSPQINILPPDLLTLPALPDGAAHLGVRPEDLVLGGEGKSGKVLAVENLGVETVVLLDLEGHSLRALLPAGETIAQGVAVPVSLRHDAALLFDAAGERLARPEKEMQGRQAHVG
jgi:multiple sugar transport system ATP-binding protein